MGMFGCFKKVQFTRCFVFVAILAFFITGSAFALEDEASLQHIEKWVNGMAVTAEGVYLSDCWAIDDTNVSQSRYVLLDQNCTEVMRVEKYPEDVSGDDTEPCAKHTISLSLVLPDETSGQVGITLENTSAVYTLFFSEVNGYASDLTLYPGTYQIVDVEVASDIDGAYKVENYTEINTLSNGFATLQIQKQAVNAENGAPPVEGSSDKENNDTNGGGSVFKPKESTLLADTVKTAGAVVVLLAVYAWIKYRRAKSEEIQSK